MFFTISKVGWLLVQPLGIVALCFAAILIFSALKSRFWMRLAALAGLVVVLLAAQTNLGILLLRPLENRFAPPEPPAVADVAGIIVLGGAFNGYVTRERGNFELGTSGDRFVEAVLLAGRYPDVPLVISGGEASLIATTEGDTAIARRFFDAFEIDADRLLLESESLNTFENAKLTAEMLPADREGRWILVTSAFHMPRSVGAFRGQGVDVIPWPVDYRTRGDERFAIGRDDPVGALGELDTALREWLGYFIYLRTGRIVDVFG